MSNTLLPCPFCGGEAKTSDTTTDEENKFEFGWIGCQECRVFINYINNQRGKQAAIAAWNRRVDARQLALKTRVCPMCEDCPDGCPIETPKDSRNKPENKPLTLDEMNALNHEPIYILHMDGHGKWSMNGWHIATASSYRNHGRCDLEIDNGNTIIDMQNYGKTWLAYRAKPERSEG